MKPYRLDGQWITIHDVIDIARNHATIELGNQAKEQIAAASKLVADSLKQQTVIYGITTGFGSFSDRLIRSSDVKTLQVNLIRSHACGVGQPYSEEVVRAMMLLRIQSLCQGHSGITGETLQTLIGMLNGNVIPYIPSQGSLGASGDLAPLAHMALTMIGEGKAMYQGIWMSSKEALALAGIAPATLQAKEGLALINGTQALTSVGLFAVYDAIQLLDMADVALAMSLSALHGIKNAFDPRISQIRPHPGHQASARNVRTLLEGNTYATNQNDLRVQDAYALRCASQVHGASRDAIKHILGAVEIEINSVSDNPLLFVEEGDVISGGNFHGQPIALPLDYLAIAISEIANISERRLERLVNPALSNGLPAFLTKFGGLQSGFMIVQYSAASLVSENKVYAHPASVDSIPSSANQEDHVSMGNFAARKSVFVFKNAIQVVQMELLAACQAIDLRELPEATLGCKLQQVYDCIRASIPMLVDDVVMYEQFEAMDELLPRLQAIIKEWGFDHAN